MTIQWAASGAMGLAASVNFTMYRRSGNASFLFTACGFLVGAAIFAYLALARDLPPSEPPS